VAGPRRLTRATTLPQRIGASGPGRHLARAAPSPPGSSQGGEFGFTNPVLIDGERPRAREAGRKAKMKRGPKPSGTAMTAAERQARFRAAHADGAPRVRYRRPADRRGMAQKWRDAVSELLDLQDAYRAWPNGLPENFAESATAEALRAICEIDLSELDNVDPPRGFGRD
jgi:hypothetical protein